MKRAAYISGLLALAAMAVGCAQQGEMNRVYTARPGAQAVPATALVFDPPVTAYTPALNLDRSQRVATANMGFDSVTTFIYTRSDDRQYFQNTGSADGYGSFGGYLDRQAIVETVGVRSR